MTTTPDPLTYGPTGVPCGCGKNAHSNLVPCQPGPVPATFGHGPEWTDVGECGARSCACPRHDMRQVCKRCVIIHRETGWAHFVGSDGESHQVHGSWVTDRQPVDWPCATAVVLGLANRTT